MIANNKASFAAGSAVYANATIMLDSCTLQGNNVSGNGAAMELTDSTQVLAT